MKLLLSYSIVIYLSVNQTAAFSQTIEEFKTNNLNNNNNITVRKLEKPSLGSLGIKTDVNDLVGLKIWQNMEAVDITRHINYTPDILLSKHLHNFLSDLYLSTSNPPSGSSDEIIKFLETRLLKIKSSGQSKKLYQLVSQLPKSDRWDFWKRWQIEYELLNRKDKKACQDINEKLKTNSENFWQMARIFCLTINGKQDQSEFILDLIKSRGFSDNIFENLFQIIIGNETNFYLEKEKNIIQPIHIIMMDALKIPVKVNYVAQLGLEYTDSFLSLNYLTPNARSFLLDKKMNYSFVPVDQVIENYKSVADGNLDARNTLSTYINKPNGYNRANVWLSVMSMKDEIKKAELILRFIKLEIKVGRFKDAVELYIPILKKIKKSSLTKELNESIKKLMVLHKPNLYPNDSLANLIMLKNEKTWNWELILKEKVWPLIPIIEKAGMKEPNSINWIDYLYNLDEEILKEDDFIRWNKSNSLKQFILKKSITKAADNNQKSLTILLIARLMGDTSFLDFDLNHLIIIRSALQKIGMKDLSNQITYEIMTYKFINF